MVTVAICQVCGKDSRTVAARSEYWTVYNFSRGGAEIKVLACTDCMKLTKTMIFEFYKQRIREGFVKELH
jgi:hypothetical protein